MQEENSEMECPNNYFCWMVNIYTKNDNICNLILLSFIFELL